MKKIAFILFTGIIVVVLMAATSVNSIKKLQWLKGSWVMKKKNGSTIMENWHVLNDSTMGGESLNISLTGQSNITEELQLVFRNNQLQYISTVTGQNNNQPVAFTVTAYSETGFVAENARHDFPKRIVYNLINQDSVHAFIDGGVSIPDKKINFYYSRYKK